VSHSQLALVHRVAMGREGRSGDLVAVGLSRLGQQDERRVRRLVRENRDRRAAPRRSAEPR
jgi:hypothetical protein